MSSETSINSKISHYIHPTNWQRQQWISKRPYGFSAYELLDKTSIIPIPVHLSHKKENFRKEFGIGKGSYRMWLSSKK